MKELKDRERLPQGWKRVKLREVIIENIKSPFKVEDADNSGVYPFFTSGERVLTHSKFLVDGENLFVSTGGTAYVKYHKGKASYSTDTYSLKTKENTKLIYYILSKCINQITFRYFIGSGLEHLQKDDFKKSFQFSIPENPIEQQKIAEILETFDNAIEKTDKIIEKYKRIKQGLMQELLTKGIDEKGNIRSEKTHQFKDSPVGRIPVEWEVKRLGEIGEIVSGSTPNTNEYKYWNGNIVWITPEDLSKTSELIINSSSRKITLLGLAKCSAKIIPANSVVISSRAPVGYVKIVSVNYTTNQGCKSIAYNEKFNPIYLACLLMIRVREMVNLSGGTTFHEITKTNLEKLQIPLPPLPEQQRMAEILSQIDKAIEKEQNYKEKLQRLKQGLMEDLLTGKVRIYNTIHDERGFFT